MSDKDTIIRWLERVERRIRANRLFQELTLGLTLFLTFPLALKIWDLFYPLRGRTITIVVGVWMVSFAAYFVWRLLQKETLGQAAASVDRRAGLHDEIKTALWFTEALGRSIRNGFFLAVFPARFILRPR
ncbi:MAG: hypothetical protein DMG11_34000 [Acidobacteria bacterium]|nr:MAG: hypothetical protein DMG11_34000 [Acidobacteriota bacterium]